MKIIQERKHIVQEYYQLCFDWDSKKERNCGFAFDCDENGNVDINALGPVAKENYNGCMAGIVDGQPIEKGRIQRCIHKYWEDAVGICNNCGEHVVLHGFTNTCVCGTDYNQAGQELAHRSQWGEETGECVSDILRADVDPWGGDY